MIWFIKKIDFFNEIHDFMKNIFSKSSIDIHDMYII